MTDTPGQGGPPADPIPDAEQRAAAGDVVYQSLQAWSHPHPTEGVVTVHFATREHPERRFTLTAGAARELAVQLMRHSKQVRRAIDDGES